MLDGCRVLFRRAYETEDALFLFKFADETLELDRKIELNFIDANGDKKGFNSHSNGKYMALLKDGKIFSELDFKD